MLYEKPSTNELLHYGKKGMRWGSKIAKTIQKGAVNVKSNNVLIEAHNAFNLSSRKKAQAKRIGNRINKLKQKQVKALNKANTYTKLANANMQQYGRLATSYATIDKKDITIGRALINYGKGSLNLNFE